MGTRWLNEWPDWFRDHGVDFEIIPGAESNSRSSGGYDGGPYCVQFHHDVSSPSKDTIEEERSWAHYHAFGSHIAPVGAATLGRSGRWYLTAFGATNTSGKGGPLQTTVGYVPKDRGNWYILAVEAMNNGQGELWPRIQVESYLHGMAVLEMMLGLDSQVRWEDAQAHFEYTNPGQSIFTGPFRKIDPAGPTEWPFNYGVPGAAYPNMWDMNNVRNDLVIVKDRLITEPEPQPEPEPDPEEDEEMANAFEALYVPNADVAATGRTKWFGQRKDGLAQHVAGPQATLITQQGGTQLPIEGNDHYDQLNAQSATIYEAP